MGSVTEHRQLEIREVRVIRVSLGKDVPSNPVLSLWFPYRTVILIGLKLYLQH